MSLEDTINHDRSVLLEDSLKIVRVKVGTIQILGRLVFVLCKGRENLCPYPSEASERPSGPAYLFNIIASTASRQSA